LDGESETHATNRRKDKHPQGELRRSHPQKPKVYTMGDPFCSNGGTSEGARQAGFRAPHVWLHKAFRLRPLAPDVSLLTPLPWPLSSLPRNVGAILGIVDDYYWARSSNLVRSWRSSTTATRFVRQISCDPKHPCFVMNNGRPIRDQKVGYTGSLSTKSIFETTRAGGYVREQDNFRASTRSPCPSPE
jgi:hypothetical protein